MKQTFGEFIRMKRKERGYRLKVFAEKVSISSVYASYIETNKRPAPSEKILKRMAKTLDLSSGEISLMYSLATASHSKTALPADLIAYINDTAYIAETIRAAKDKRVSSDGWLEIKNLLEDKYE